MADIVSFPWLVFDPAYRSPALGPNRDAGDADGFMFNKILSTVVATPERRFSASCDLTPKTPEAIKLAMKTPFAICGICIIG
ncbi:hypothetical protein [Pseudaminobacter salicylatoxidans]|uniref:hypothetical protein n=1 Tax=Pseudaminobacter salicylatoxidans TaxID=93369 RepID=UPI0011B21F96|nr:hypothetical protein [Pseudaminobacter salicylatoxidans]